MFSQNYCGQSLSRIHGKIMEKGTVIKTYLFQEQHGRRRVVGFDVDTAASHVMAPAWFH